MKNVALEYHYQGHENTFLEIMQTIVDAITKEDEFLVKKSYEQHKDFDNDFVDIHFRLIASLLNEYIDLKKKYLDFQHKDIEEIELKIIEAFKALDKNCSKETQFKEYFIILTAFFKYLQKFNQQHESKEAYETDILVDRMYKRLLSTNNQKEKDLKQYMDDCNNMMSIRNVKIFLFQLLRGLSYCHSRFVHFYKF